MTRASGRTTRQMQEAPRGALYIWPNQDLGYPKSLAKAIQREDLDIQGAWTLTSVGRFMGLTFPDIILDHAVRLSSRQIDIYNEIKMRVTT